MADSKRERLDRLVAEIDEVLAQSMADAVERTLQLATPHLAGQNPADELLPCCELYPHGPPMPVDELNLTAWVPLGPIWSENNRQARLYDSRVLGSMRRWTR